jgi:hypothetical protein
MVIHVDLGEKKLASVLFCEPFQDRTQDAARTAPGRPKIHQHWHFLRTLQNRRFEIIVADFNGPLIH